MTSLPELLKAYMSANKLTYRSLAEKANNVLGFSSIHEISRGDWLPSQSRLLKFCEAIGEDPSAWITALLCSKAMK